MNFESSRENINTLNEQQDNCMDENCLATVMGNWDKELNSIFKIIRSDQSVTALQKKALSDSQSDWIEYNEKDKFLAESPVAGRLSDSFSHQIGNAKDRANELIELFSENRPFLPKAVQDCVDNAATKSVVDTCYREGQADLLSKIRTAESELWEKLPTPEGKMKLTDAQGSWRNFRNSHVWLIQTVADSDNPETSFQHNAAVFSLYQNRLTRLKSLSTPTD